MLIARQFQKWGKILTVSLILIMLLSLLLISNGCEKPKVYRIGVLSGLDFIAPITDGFKSQMTELGYVEGKNVIYDVQQTNFDLDIYKTTLKKFIDDKVDLIMAFPTEATIEAKNATAESKIPVVFNFCLIEGMNVVKSVAEPGGNVTGVRYPGPDLSLKRFEIMQQLVPKAKRYLIPYQKGYPIVNVQLDMIRPSAAAAGITIIEAPADNAAELSEILKKREKTADIGIDAILFIPEPLTVTPETFAVIGEFAYNHKIPVGGALMTAGKYSTIFGLNVDLISSGKQAAPIADKILKGASAGTIPVVSAENFLQINYKATQAEGITVPEALLKQANEVIR